VIAGLEAHVERRAARSLARRAQRLDLGVGSAEVRVPALLRRRRRPARRRRRPSGSAPSVPTRVRPARAPGASTRRRPARQSARRSCARGRCGIPPSRTCATCRHDRS
jgi:hypothetical protein